jgi:transposase
MLCWAKKLQERRGYNVAAVALANKMARVIWAILAQDRAYVPVWSKSLTSPV